ncbi:MAG: DUF4352 domain-containing protein [Chloroflexota bacterium]
MSDSAIVCAYCGKNYSTDYDACPGCGTLRDEDLVAPLVVPEPSLAPEPRSTGRVPGLGADNWWVFGLGAAALFIVLALIAVGLTGNLNALILGLDVLAIALLVANPWRLRARLPVVGSPSKQRALFGWLGLGLIAVVALATFPGGIVAMPITPEGKAPPTSTVGATAGAVVAPAGVSAAATRSATPTVGEPRLFAVGNTGGDGVWLRASPDMDDRLRAWPDGTVMVQVGPDSAVDGHNWRNVKDPVGNLGWVPAEYLVASPSGTDLAGAPSPTPPQSSVGTVTANGRSLTVVEVVRLREVGQVKAEATKEYVVLSLVIKNVDAKRIAYDRLDFRIEDGNGNITKAVTVAGLDNQLHEGELAPGGSVKGFVVFEVPKGDRDLALIWVPCALGCAEQDIPLGARG